MRPDCDEFAGLSSTSSNSAPILATAHGHPSVSTTTITTATTAAPAAAGGAAVAGANFDAAAPNVARRKLRIFKEPSGSSISQVIWTPKLSCVSQTSSVESASVEHSAGYFTSSNSPQPKLSNASCASLPLPVRNDLVRMSRRRLSPPVDTKTDENSSFDSLSCEFTAQNLLAQEHVEIVDVVNKPSDWSEDSSTASAPSSDHKSNDSNITKDILFKQILTKIESEPEILIENTVTSLLTDQDARSLVSPVCANSNADDEASQILVFANSKANDEQHLTPQPPAENVDDETFLPAITDANYQTTNLSANWDADQQIIVSANSDAEEEMTAYIETDMDQDNQRCSSAKLDKKDEALGFWRVFKSPFSRSESALNFFAKEKTRHTPRNKSLEHLAERMLAPFLKEDVMVDTTDSFQHGLAELLMLSIASSKEEEKRAEEEKKKTDEEEDEDEKEEEERIATDGERMREDDEDCTAFFHFYGENEEYQHAQTEETIPIVETIEQCASIAEVVQEALAENLHAAESLSESTAEKNRSLQSGTLSSASSSSDLRRDEHSLSLADDECSGGGAGAKNRSAENLRISESSPVPDGTFFAESFNIYSPATDASAETSGFAFDIAERVERGANKLVELLDAEKISASKREEGETHDDEDATSKAGTECSFDFTSNVCLPTAAAATSVSASTPAPIFKCIRQLRVGIIQLREFAMDALVASRSGCAFDDVYLTVSVKHDSIEVFQSTPVLATQNCSLGVESACELPNDFHAFHVILTQICNGSRVSCPVGRVTVSRRELLETPQRYEDIWLPIMRVVGAPCTELLGDMCIDTRFDVASSVLSIQIIDYTIWPIRHAKINKHDNNNNNKITQHQQQQHQQQHPHQHHQLKSGITHSRQNSMASSGSTSASAFFRGSGEKLPLACKDALEFFHQQTGASAQGGLLFLRMCVSAGNTQYSPMKKLRVACRRGIEIAHLDCSQILPKKSTSSSSYSVSSCDATPSTSARCYGSAKDVRVMANSGEREKPPIVSSVFARQSHGSAPQTPLKSLSPPPRPPPPRLPPTHKNATPLTVAGGVGILPTVEKEFFTLENDILLSRSGSAKSRLKARSRLLSSGPTSKSNVVLAEHRTPIENPLRAADSTHTILNPKKSASRSKPPENNSSILPYALNNLKKKNGSYSTSNIPDSFSFLENNNKINNNSNKKSSNQKQQQLKLRLNIKVYGDASYDESSYCGYVRIPLDEATMLPKDLPLGPNWFNIKSRSTSACAHGENSDTTQATTHAHQHGGNGTPQQQRHANATPKGGRHAPPSGVTYSFAAVPAEQRDANSKIHKANYLATSGGAHALTGHNFIASLETPPLHFRHASSQSSKQQPPALQQQNRFDAATTLANDAFKTSRPLSSSRASALNIADSNSAPMTVNYCSAPSTAKNTASTSKSVMRGEAGSGFTVFATTAKQQQHTTVAANTEKIGEMRLKLRYSVDEILPLVHYQPLYLNLINSLSIKPYSASLTSILQYLPISTENIARPLMKIFVHANQIRPFLRLICTQYVSGCQADVNTLFRSHSMASKVLCELMDFVGQEYLVVTLKPLIDLIYAERKSCEIDPSKKCASDSLEQNLRNLIVYAELAFSRVVDSRHRCPRILREVLAELRDTVAERFPGRDDVARLAISSFLMLRFFSAAILHPKHFSLRCEAPEAEVSRTLVLVSKILQRLANCVVSAHPFFAKEEWLTPVLQRFLDDAHKRAMTRFLDVISTIPSKQHTNSGEHKNHYYNEEDYICVEEDADEGSELHHYYCCDSEAGLLSHGGGHQSRADERLSLSCHELGHGTPALLKHGYMIERRSGSDKKKSFKNFIHQKRRYVTLTETQLSWRKVSGNVNNTSASAAELHHSLSLHSHFYHSGHNHTHLHDESGGCGTIERATAQRKSSAEKTMADKISHRHSLYQPHSTLTQQHQQQLQQLQQLQPQGEQKGHFALSEVTCVSPLSDAKNSFRVVTPHSEVHFQANSPTEMNEWLILIQKQQRRHIMMLNRSSSEAPRINSTKRSTLITPTNNNNNSNKLLARSSDTDIEREMQIIHAHLLEHLDTLCQWKSVLEREHAAVLQQFSHNSALAAVQKQHYQQQPQQQATQVKQQQMATIVALPLEKIFKTTNTIAEREACLARLYETLVATIAGVQQIEGAHQTARNLSFQMRMLRQQNLNNENNNKSSNNNNYNNYKSVKSNDNGSGGVIKAQHTVAKQQQRLQSSKNNAVNGSSIYATINPASKTTTNSVENAAASAVAAAIKRVRRAAPQSNASAKQQH